MVSLTRTLRASKPLKNGYYACRNILKRAAYYVSPKLLAKCRYRAAWGEWPNFSDPRTFDEKLLWLMLNDRDPRKAECTDKYAKNAFVEKLRLDHILPKVFGIYEHVDEIRLADLPDRFVLKCTHSCKSNVFCKNKANFNLDDAKKDLRKWMRVNYSLVSGEIHYAAIRPRIMCEELLEEPGAELPTDYKLHCFNGKARGTLVCTERDPNGVPKLQYYDREWKVSLPYIIPRIKADAGMLKPAAYDEMVQIAETLAHPFPFLRVDFYYVQGLIRLGELTFTPGSCVSVDYLNRHAQQELGALIRLPANSHKSRLSFQRSPVRYPAHAGF